MNSIEEHRGVCEAFISYLDPECLRSFRVASNACNAVSRSHMAKNWTLNLPDVVDLILVRWVLSSRVSVPWTILSCLYRRCRYIFDLLPGLTVLRCDSFDFSRAFPSSIKKIEFRETSPPKIWEYTNETLALPPTILDAQIFVPRKKRLVIGHTLERLVLMGIDFMPVLNAGLLHLELPYGFDDLLELPPQLQTIKFGSRFNRPVSFPDTVTSIRFGDRFNQELILPSNLQELSFSTEFDRDLHLPPSVKYLTLGKRFNRIILLPLGLQRLIFGEEFDQPVELPQSLVDLDLGQKFNRELTLPESLRRLEMSNKYERALILNDGLAYVDFRTSKATVSRMPRSLLSLYGTLEANLNQGLLKLKFRRGFNQHVELPESLQCVDFGNTFNQPVVLPVGLLVVCFGLSFNQPLDLPPNLVELYIVGPFNHPLVLPDSLIIATLQDSFNHPILLPQRLESVTFGADFNQRNIVFPRSLKLLSCGVSLSLPDHIPGLEKIREIGGNDTTKERYVGHAPHHDRSTKRYKFSIWEGVHL